MTSVGVDIRHTRTYGEKREKREKVLLDIVDQLYAEDVAMQAHFHKVLGWLQEEDALIKARTAKFVSRFGEPL